MSSEFAKLTNIMIQTINQIKSNQINFIADNVKYSILQQQILHNNTMI